MHVSLSDDCRRVLQWHAVAVGRRRGHAPAEGSKSKGRAIRTRARRKILPARRLLSTSFLRRILPALHSSLLPLPPYAFIRIMRRLTNGFGTVSFHSWISGAPEVLVDAHRYRATVRETERRKRRKNENCITSKLYVLHLCAYGYTPQDMDANGNNLFSTLFGNRYFSLWFHIRIPFLHTLTHESTTLRPYLHIRNVYARGAGPYQWVGEQWGERFSLDPIVAPPSNKY